MRLVTIAIYNAAGDVRRVDFGPGLNIVTGVSATGKSALLEIVEYCLGRNTLTTPVGPIRDTAAWYGLIVQLQNQQAFIGRPAPQPGMATSQQGMLEFGVDLRLPEFSSLGVNVDTRTIRDQLGRAIGIDEGQTDGGTSGPYEPNLGHAVLFCLQRQSEVANRDQLFHRQGEEGIGRAIQEVLPYFLGALPRDRAVLRQRLLAAKRDLRSAERELQGAEAADENMEVSLRAFVTEAQAAGLLTDNAEGGTVASLQALRAVVSSPVPQVALDDQQASRRSELERQRQDLRQSLYETGRERAVLDALETDESGYEGVVAQQVDRLRSLELLGTDADGSPNACPICGSHLPEEDPTVQELRATAAEIGAQAGTFAVMRPRRRQAIDEITSRADALREQIRSLDQALDAIEATERDVSAGRRFTERQAFVQGRIQHYLEGAALTDEASLLRLQERVRVRQARVDDLEAQLDEDGDREQLLSRLVAIGRDMTAWADRLGLEHSGEAVRLDPRRLTVVADTPSGPAPLNQIGSAANWIGYHLVAHLALHKFFVRQDRPVPHFLMLDQPTQAYYPSDVAQETGLPDTDADRAAVDALFQLMAAVVDELDGEFQVIVCDHANLPEQWFQDAIAANWRNGERLIPESWIAAPPEAAATEA